MEEKSWWKVLGLLMKPLVFLQYQDEWMTFLLAWLEEFEKSVIVSRLQSLVSWPWKSL